ncbi:HNH endonuclease [Paenibacillus kobensis]|uniref:HNH endonuclease n=1 Tax=Paenibacillus kobensis TaxID=59841 RepID=UPI001C3FDB2A|nr:HNH endonuclease [Paenibacillus kobensis]
MITHEEDKDVVVFAQLLSRTSLPENKLYIGSFSITGRQGIESNLQYRHEDWQLLGTSHEYTFPLMEGDIQISLQLYENMRDHYRLYCYCKFGRYSGMLFSINLTTEKDAEGSIFLTQQIKFSDRMGGDSKHAQHFRQMKQAVFVSMLRKLGYEVTDQNHIILGIYDTKTASFLNTTSEKFLSDFILISLLKGHFMGNKGFELEILPSYNKMTDLFVSNNDAMDDEHIPAKVHHSQRSRAIPLGVRFKVLERDKGTCKLCGRAPADGVKLHVDHIVPFSLGGLTVMDNLQTLCSECNIGKSNRSVERY